MHEREYDTNLRVPQLIKRNTVLLAFSQCFTGAGMQLGYGIGPLMFVIVSGSSSLAGLSVVLLALSRFLVSYPVGKITDAFGRKPGIMLGLVLALGGALVVGLSMTNHSLSALIAGMLLFGMGMNAAQQMRVAATDMFPPRMRAQALGYVATGSLPGLVIGPLLIAGSDAYAPSVGLEALALPWLLLPVLIIAGMVLVAFIRPDPREIGLRLGEYYPNYTPAKAGPDGSPSADVGSSSDLLRQPATRLAIAANCAAQANMSIVMVLTSLVLSHHGHSLAAIGFSHMFHSAGMFAFTVPLGWLADRFGREKVMYPGLMTTIVGAALVTLGEGISLVTLGTFLVGIGWAAANVAATALIADHAGPVHRGRAIGLNDSVAGAGAVITALITGPLIQRYGLGAAGVAAMMCALPPLLMRARALGDGVYARQ